MFLINFSHPITDSQLESLARIVGRPVDRVIEIKTHLDHQQSFHNQVSLLVDQVGLSATEWQTIPLMLMVPSLATVAVLVLAELHGRMGYFPPVVRLRPVPDAMPPVFEPAEVMNLQEIRSRARMMR